MPEITWPHAIGQKRVKEVLESAIANGSLGHAYLFSGAEGCGKFATALDCALTLLCENGQERPCLACPSCRKVLDYAHPDLHIIMPVVLSKEHKGDKGELTAAGWEYVAACAKERIDSPYATPDRTKVPSIPVDWVREINHTIKAGTHAGGANVAIIDGIDTLNKESANSMLKLLEEPPAGTVLILLTDRIGEVLPTIISRCQILRFAWLAPSEIREGLERRFGGEVEGRELERLTATGSLGRSFELWDNPREEIVQAADRFLDLCAGRDWVGLASYLDEIREWDNLDNYEFFFTSVASRLRGSFLDELPGTEKVFLGGTPGPGIPKLSVGELDRLIDVCGRSIAAVRAHGNMLLVLAQCAIAITEAFHGEKQQNR